MNVPLPARGQNVPIPNYDDLFRRRQEGAHDHYSADLDRLYARYKGGK